MQAFVPIGVDPDDIACDIQRRVLLICGGVDVPHGAYDVSELSKPVGLQFSSPLTLENGIRDATILKTSISLTMTLRKSIK
jgi:hypothetical protein